MTPPSHLCWVLGKSVDSTLVIPFSNLGLQLSIWVNVSSVSCRLFKRSSTKCRSHIPQSPVSRLLWVLYPDQLSVTIFTFDLLTTFWVNPTSVLQIILFVSRHEKGFIIAFPWQIYSRRHQHIIRELHWETPNSTLDLHASMVGILVIDNRFTSLTSDRWMSSSVWLQSNLFTFDEMC